MSEKEEMEHIMFPGIGDEALEKLANDILDNKVFTSLAITPEDAMLLPLTFMAILLQEKRVKNLFYMFPPAMIYEDMDKATQLAVANPESILDNILYKYPRFNTMKCINETDFKILQEKYKKLKNARTNSTIT